MSMPFDHGMEVVECAVTSFEDEQLYARWIVAAQFEMTFQDFKKKVGCDDNKRINDRYRKPETQDSIFDKVRSIIGG